VVRGDWRQDGQELVEVESGCVVVEAMWKAGKYLRVPISALLLKQLDFKLYTKHTRLLIALGWL
jgi:hypothetical protein